MVIVDIVAAAPLETPQTSSTHLEVDVRGTRGTVAVRLDLLHLGIGQNQNRQPWKAQTPTIHLVTCSDQATPAGSHPLLP